MALEMEQDMNDIDVCVVSETHLRPDVPDAVIVMSNYALFRRDRNWNGTDMSTNGGIAIYNLRSKFFRRRHNKKIFPFQ